MAASKTYSDLCMVVRFERGKYGERYAHVNCRIDRIDDGYFSTYEEGGHLRSLAIESQTDAEALAGKKSWREYNSPMYAVKVTWNDSSTRSHTLESLEAGVKTLKAVHKYLDKVEEKFGPPASFGAMVQRVCMASGIENVKVRGGDHCQDSYGTMSPEAARNAIDYQIRCWEADEIERAKSA